MYYVLRFPSHRVVQSGTDPRLVAQSMQRVIQQWGDLMEVTEGAVASEKTYWYLVEYIWKHGKWTAMQEMVLTSCHEMRSEMIGIWMAPNGDTTVLIEKLREAATSWGVKMRMGRSSKLEAWTGLQTNIFATLKYPLAACTLTESECKSIMAPAVRAALPKAGISSTMSTTVRNAPIESLGMGVLDSYLFMGTARTSMMTHHCWSNTPTGVLLQMCIEDLALDSGLYGLLWNQEFKFSQWTINYSSSVRAHFENIISASNQQIETIP
eukprot:scaffold7605_cov133-Chaetoceros_neogracile.AAC.1